MTNSCCTLGTLRVFARVLAGRKKYIYRERERDIIYIIYIYISHKFTVHSVAILAQGSSMLNFAAVLGGAGDAPPPAANPRRRARKSEPARDVPPAPREKLPRAFEPGELPGNVAERTPQQRRRLAVQMCWGKRLKKAKTVIQEQAEQLYRDPDADDVINVMRKIVYCVVGATKVAGRVFTRSPQTIRRYTSCSAAIVLWMAISMLEVLVTIFDQIGLVWIVESRTAIINLIIIMFCFLSVHAYAFVFSLTLMFISWT